MRKELALALLPLVLLIGSSSGYVPKPCPPDNFNKVDVLAGDIRKTSSFGLDLFKKIKEQVPGKNLFFSPYSVWSVLAIAYFGAEGNTLAQLQKALRLGEKDKGYKTQRLLSANLGKNKGIQLDEANRAYLADFLVLEECFRSGKFYDVHQFDFSNPVRLAEEVNGFVNRTTKGLIPKLVTASNTAESRFLLVNAVYFKGFWKEPFLEFFTRKRDFFCNPGRPCGEVDMMEKHSYFNHVNSTQLGAEVLEVPYINSSISMLLFLPWENAMTVDDIVDRLDLPTLTATVDSLERQRMVIWLPKFKMKQTLSDELLLALQELGITDLFSNNADLSAFTKSMNLSADKIIHKAVVDVNEKGTEGAAGSVSIIKSVPPRIRFNRPFVFAVVEKGLRLTLFGGIYRAPPV